MAGAFEQSMFFSTAMITTSARLQHLDSHFYLHAKLSGCRQATSRPHVDRIHSSPPLLASTPTKNVTRSHSRSSRCSDAASFHTAVSKAEKEDDREEKTASLPYKDVAERVLKDGQPGEAMTSEVMADAETGSGWTPCPEGPMVFKPLQVLPERPHATGQKDSPHRALDRRRRTSTTSEPLPRSCIPRRTSSTAHRRQRKGQDLISFHRDSCRLFQSLEGTLFANCEDSRPILSRHASMPGSPSLPFFGSLDLPGVSRQTEGLENHSEDEASADGGRKLPELVVSTVSLPVLVEIGETASPTRTRGATVMSWTTAETRKREYEKIDQAHGGLRGLWKKLTPKWCHGRNARRKFFEGKCDGDSVRRYRV